MREHCWSPGSCTDCRAAGRTAAEEEVMNEAFGTGTPEEDNTCYNAKLAYTNLSVSDIVNIHYHSKV